ncbi:type II secretion system F family protein [Desertibacillus haloalkaliphilus]|uniref:type II secretion system F family protein n=1 Tax=Desertibacillus haloalkaliphilus TaxID=1328930 RepID=UPI001C269EF3|nr:type II secretion system F family protein [Desertibacillus haloalkaliphilus]MBU8908036.1 type II secretion system F family protein [Desertibacillus haloalkaliphilus]
MFFILFVVFTVLFAAIGMWFGKRNERYEQRIGKYLPREKKEKKRVEKKEAATERRRLIEQLGRPFQNVRFVQKWEIDLEKAGLTINAEGFFIMRLVLGGLAFVVAFIIDSLFIVMVLFFIGGFFLPILYLKRKKQLRLVQSAQQLPHALGTMETAMKAGFSFIQSMQVVAQEVPDPLGPEFNKTIREINLGETMESAFAHLLNRLPNEDLKLVVSALLIQRTTGGNLADLLGSMQETIRERVRIQEELKTLTSQGRMSAWIITLLPFVLGLLLNLMNPEYFEPLFTHPLGWFLMSAGVISALIGWIAIQKIINVEV